MAESSADGRVDEGRRNSDIREETNIRESLGDPDIGNETEKITPENDLFHDQREERQGPADTAEHPPDRPTRG